MPKIISPVQPLTGIIGLSCLSVAHTFNLPFSNRSQPHPEPKGIIATVLNYSLNLSKEPKSFSIAVNNLLFLNMLSKYCIKC